MVSLDLQLYAPKDPVPIMAASVDGQLNPRRQLDWNSLNVGEIVAVLGTPRFYTGKLPGCHFELQCIQAFGQLARSSPLKRAANDAPVCVSPKRGVLAKLLASPLKREPLDDAAIFDLENAEDEANKE